MGNGLALFPYKWLLFPYRDRALERLSRKAPSRERVRNRSRGTTALNALKIGNTGLVPLLVPL
jgi:hypothetical protein